MYYLGDYYFDEYTAFAVGIGIIVYFVTLVLVYLLGAFQYWKVLEKTGESGWTCLVPFYREYLLFKRSMGTGWFFLLLYVPVASLIIRIFFVWKMAKAFGKDIAYAVGLYFLPFIFFLLLGFGDAKYLGVPDETSSFTL